MRAADALVLAAVLTGCAVPSPPVRLADGAPPGDASGAALGVAPFRDLRPAEQREGRQPHLVPLLLWNQRIGEYVTGSDAFVDDPLEAVRGGVARAFAAGPFGGVRLLEAASAEAPLAQHCNAHGLRWLATGAVMDLYGTLHQSTYVLFLPTPWTRGRTWDHRVTDPFGVASVRVEVYDCVTEDRVFAQSFSARRRCPDRTASQAARAALDEVLAELRDVLTDTASPHEGPETPEFLRLDPL